MMQLSRRHWLALMPALVASAGSARGQAPLPSRALRFEDLPVQSYGENKFRPVLEGETHRGWRIEVHQTELAPGTGPHAGHRHRHEEMFLIREGMVEITLAGRRTQLGPGSVAFVASDDDHAIRNAGTTRAQYFVIVLGRDEA